MIKFITNAFEFISFFFKLVFRFFKFVLMLTGVISFSRCGGSGYQKDGDKVFFDGKEVSKDLKVLNEVFAKDDTTAYFKRYSIPDADVATFSAVDRHYAKDKNTVYYCDESRDGVNYYLTKHSVIVRVKHAHPASFVSMGNGYTEYARDDQRGYFQGVGFAVQDVASLEIIDGYFLKDKHLVYYGQVPVKGSDPGSFRILNHNYAQDTAQVYYYTFPNEGGITVIPCEGRSFSLLEYPYSKDESSVFYIHAKMKGVEAATFSILGNNYSKDRQTVFFEDKKISEADAATFEVMPEYKSTTQELYFAKDHARVFWKDQKVAGAAPSAFRAIDFGYATDGKHVFYQTAIVKDADPGSFKVYPHGVGNADAEDKNRKYSEGKKVPE
ncbi:MAG: DKNYY domain-containing protein [Saprospiraceae bacterium]|nr:DKNYY domain-containing protein [Saprospiraceae bacterium]